MDLIKGFDRASPRFRIGSANWVGSGSVSLQETSILIGAFAVGICDLVTLFRSVNVFEN